MQSINSLTDKIGLSLIQPQPSMVVLKSLKPQNSDAQRTDRYIAPPRRDIKFGQPSKGKEIAESPEVMGVRPNLNASRVGNTLPVSVQSAQTPPGLGCDGIPFGTHQNYRKTYNPLFEGQAAGGQG